MTDKERVLFEWCRLVGGNPGPGDDGVTLLRKIWLATIDETNG